MNAPLVFEWDEAKNRLNQDKHGVSFQEAQQAFADPDRVIFDDLEHSEDEQRYFCLGKVARGTLTVRFTYRGEHIRIIGAGFWRAGRKRYEQVQGNG
jgi:uncharacterized DUF497 family protein